MGIVGSPSAGSLTLRTRWVGPEWVLAVSKRWGVKNT